MLNLNNQNKWSVAAITNWRPSAGADYDCSSTDAYCTDNITTAELNDTGRMIFDTTLQPAYLAGIRFDSINQTRWNKFISDLYLFSHNDTFIMNLGENADTYEARGARPAGYNMQSWIAEMNAFVAAVNTSTATGRYMIGGPGINSNSTAWVNNMSQVFANCTANPVLSCIFTMQMNFFENDTDVSL